MRPSRPADLSRAPQGAHAAERHVGIDWATEAHRVVVVDGERRVAMERTVLHEAVAFGALGEPSSPTSLAAYRVDVAVALETPPVAPGLPRLRLGYQQHGECATLIERLFRMWVSNKSIVTCRSSGPCRESAESSPPPEIITGCARTSATPAAVSQLRLERRGEIRCPL